MSTRGHGHRYRFYRLSDVLFRIGAALAVSWVYLRTLLVVAPGTDPQTWAVFAWTGWPFVLMVWVGAVSTLAAWLRET